MDDKRTNKLIPKKRDKLYKLSLRKNKTYKSYDKYITYRNTYNSLKRKAKESSYYQKLLTQYNN